MQYLANAYLGVEDYRSLYCLLAVFLTFLTILIMNVHDGKEGEEFRLGVYLTQSTLINIDCIVSGVVCI